MNVNILQSICNILKFNKYIITKNKKTGNTYQPNNSLNINTTN